MKKSELVLLTFVPILVGYLINATFFIPVIGTLLFYILPIVVLAFWFWLGSQYSKTDWGMVPSILIGSATGVLSLALYLWQFLGQSDETRNMNLAVLSQMYSAATPGYLFARLAMMFESQSNYVGKTTALAMQIIPVILMIAIFTFGYYWGKTHQVKRKCDEFPKQK